MDCLEANKFLTPQRNDFAVRFLCWSEKEVEREVLDDFSRVRNVKSRRAFHYLEFMAGLPNEERMPAALALLRSSIIHRTAIEVLGLEQSEADRDYVRAFQSRFYPVAFASTLETDLLDNTSLKDFEINRDLVERVLIVECSKKLQLPPIRESSCGYQEQIGEWYLRTSVDVHSIYQLRYGHSITARPPQNWDRDLCPVHLKEGGISILGWLGVHPSTDYDLLLKEDIEETAIFVADTIKYFVDAIPDLIAGLANKIPIELTGDKRNARQTKRK